MRGVVLALAALLLLSGCAGSPSSTSSSTTSSSSSAAATTTSPSTTTTTAGTTSSSGTTTQPPALAITSFQVNRTAGAAPLAVRFNFTLAGATSYRLAFGDGSADATGTAAAGALTHSYPAAGNYTARLTASNGGGSSVNRTLTVRATSAAAPPVVFTGGYESGSAALCSYGAGGPGGSHPAEAGVTYFSVDLGEAFVGKPFTAQYTFTVPAVALVVAFPDGDGSFAGVVSDFPNPESTVLTGRVPDGAASAQVTSCGGAGVSVTFTVG